MSDLLDKKAVDDNPLPTFAKEAVKVVSEYQKGQAKRPGVADYLRDQRMKALLERLPSFEQMTVNDIQALKNDVASLEFRLMMTHWVLAIMVVIAVFLRLM